MNEVPGFPLIAKKGWLLKKPAILTESSPLPGWNPYFKEQEARRLEGLNVDYVALKSRLMPKRNRPWDGEAYRILDVIPTDDDLRMTFGVAGYFHYVNTCEAAAVELADVVRSNSAGGIPKASEHRGPPEAIFDLEGRSRIAAVNCILILKNYSVGAYSDQTRRQVNKFVLHERGESVLSGQNCTHVVPAGTHQPLSKGFGDLNEISIWQTAIREFCEELFNKEELAKFKRLGESFLDLPEIKPYVNAFFRSGAATVYLMGVGLEPLTMNFEILTAIVADWSKASTSAILKFDENYEGKIHFVDLTRENLKTEAVRVRNGREMTPAAKACLLLAAEHYPALMGPPP